MNTTRFLCAALLLFATATMADWTAQNEKACDANTAGQFKYYTLTLSWSPEFCRANPSKKNEAQCTQKRGFIVHGLWPECETHYPQACKKGGAKDAIDPQKIYAFMPSDYLIEHEWDKHGTCSGLARSAYFNEIAKAYGNLKLPTLKNGQKADQIEAAFIALNPGLKAENIYLSCTEKGTKMNKATLDEVRICIAKDTLAFTQCDNVQESCKTLKQVLVTSGAK